MRAASSVAPPIIEVPSDLDWSGNPFPVPPRESAPVRGEVPGATDAETTGPITDLVPGRVSAAATSSEERLEPLERATGGAPGDVAGRPGHPRSTAIGEDLTAAPGNGPVAVRVPLGSEVTAVGGGELVVPSEDVFAGLFGESAADDPTAELPPEVPPRDGPAGSRPEWSLAVPGENLDGDAAAAVVAAEVARAAPRLVSRDAAAATATGALGYVRALADPRAAVGDRAADWALDAARRAAERTAAVLSSSARGAEPAPGQVSWTQAGQVVPILGAGHGAGASVCAAALFDALDAAAVATLLVDAADPARSGLSRATAHAGSAHDRRPHPEVGIAYAPRGGGWVAALDSPADAAVTDSLVPDPTWWLPQRSAPAVTVVDLAWDPFEIAGTPLRGPGAWLEAGHPAPRPLLVAAATVPGLAKARELLVRLRPWVERGVIAAPVALVLSGVSRWPRELREMAVRELGALAEQAVLLPHHRTVAMAGVGPAPLPARLRTPMTALLARLARPRPTAPVPGHFPEGR